MATVLDVAAYILQRNGPMSAMKLQKLTYYSQAWSLVWDEQPLFHDRIEAWANGPVSPMLYSHHRGQFTVSQVPAGNPQHLTDAQVATIDSVLAYYGDKTAQWLSDLTHLEAPWRDARGNLPDGASCCAEITHVSMAEYYSSLPPEA